jgi:hypothetical protein
MNRRDFRSPWSPVQPPLPRCATRLRRRLQSRRNVVLVHGLFAAVLRSSAWMIACGAGLNVARCKPVTTCPGGGVGRAGESAGRTYGSRRALFSGMIVTEAGALTAVGCRLRSCSSARCR